MYLLRPATACVRILFFPYRFQNMTISFFLLEETNDSAGFEVHVHIVETRAGR